MQLPGMLYGRFFTSPYPHGESSGWTRAALRRCLASARPPLRRSGTARRRTWGASPPPWPVLPAVAHFEGEEVGAFVVADTESIAEDALKLIEVEWEQRPFVLDTEAALRTDAPLANPESSPEKNHFNEGFMDITRRGDVAVGFAEADVFVEFKSVRRLHTWIGPERPCGVFRWNGQYPEIWLKTQRPNIGKRVVASGFGGIPMSQIQVHCLYQGASFGGWSQMAWNYGGLYCAGVVAKRTGRP